MAPQRNNPIVILLVGLIGVPLFFCGTFYMFVFYSWRDTTPRGPLVAATDWPEPIQDLHEAMDAAGINTETFSVYLLYGQPGSTWSTVVCRMDCDESAWTLIQDRLSLQSIPRAQGIRLHKSIVPTSSAEWWPSPEDQSVNYFASARLLAGDEADLYYAAYDASSSRAFIHYHFNF